jgi:UDP-N-acetylglucosamine 4-epimerase
MLVAARDASVKRFIYASSCAVYGDCEELPLVEDKIGDFLSPYAADKFVNELHADLFSRLYNLNTIGLRYFNIFGPRQDSTSSYSSVMARWFSALICNKKTYIYGDGKTTRDFCYIEDCIQANILAASTQNPEASNNVYNIGSGQSTDLNNLYKLINNSTAKEMPEVKNTNPIYQDFRPGDVRHSLADISRANKLLFYQPAYSLHEGLDKTAIWYLGKLR